jgi:hypothetical protein
MSLTFVVALGVCCAEWPERGPGELRGVVVNASRDHTPCPHAEVVLRVQQDDQFVPVAETVTDAGGRFRFAGLPLGRQYLYLPGANRDDVHYPGLRLRLTGADPVAEVTLAVHDAVRRPNPLRIQRHEILIRPQVGMLHVTEALVIRNPTDKTYVGEVTQPGGQPVSLRLSIPRDFERTTFFKEFYGRQFALADGQLVTGLPWTPGERDLKFMYTIRNEQVGRVWQRPLDLPCEHLAVHVLQDDADAVTCNLDPLANAQPGERAFGSRGQRLPAGFVVRVELGRLPVSWTTYAKWATIAVLLVAVAGTAAMLLWRRGGARPAATSAAGERVAGGATPHPLRLARAPRRRRKAA